MKSNKRIKFSRRVVIILTALISIFPFTAFADTQSILKKFQFEESSAWQSPLRQFAWSAAVGLHWLVSGIEDMVYNINGTIGDFFQRANVQALQGKALGISIALLTLMLAFLGILSMFKPQQYSTIISNFVMGVVIAFSIPTLMAGAYELANQAISFINSDSNGKFQKYSDRILVDNVTDNYLYDQTNFQLTTLKTKNYFIANGNLSAVTGIDPTEVIYPDKTKNPDVWKNYIATDFSGKETLQELNTGKLGFIDIPMLGNYYYRWKIDWLNIFSTLIITGVALIFSGVKIARLLYELAIHQTLIQVFALLDVFTMQRLKKCIQSLIASFCTLAAVFFMLQLYLVGMETVSTVSNPILRLFLMIALAWSVIDGPNLFEQVFGVDAGINSALRTAYGLKAAGGIMAGGIAALGGKGMLDSIRSKGLVGSAKSVAGAVGSIAGKMGGGVAGIASGMKENHQRYQAVRGGGGAGGAAAVGKATAQPKGSASGGTKSSSAAASPFIPAGGSGSAAQPAESAATSAQPLPGSGSAEPTATSLHDSASIDAAETVPAGNEPSLHSTENPQETNSEQEGEVTPPIPTVEPETLGGKIRAAATNKMNQNPTIAATRRAYGLTRGSMQAHGNKKTAIMENVRTIQNATPNVTPHDAKKQAKEMYSKSKNQLHDNRSFAEKERDTERKTLHGKDDKT